MVQLGALVVKGKGKGKRVAFASPESEEDAVGPATRSRMRRDAAALMSQDPAEDSRAKKRKWEEVEEVEEREAKKAKKAESVVAKVIP